MEISNGELKEINDRLDSIDSRLKREEDSRKELTRLIMGDPNMGVEPLRKTVNRLDKIFRRAVWVILGATITNGGIVAAIIGGIF